MKNLSLLIVCSFFSFHLLLNGQEGALDPAFGQGGRVAFGFDGAVDTHDPTSIAVQSDGKILVAGFGFHVPGANNSHTCIARLLPNGGFDPGFSGDGKAGFVLDANQQFNPPRVVKVLDNGKILLLVSAGIDLYFLKLLPNGEPDPDFGTAGVLKIKQPLLAAPGFLSSHFMAVLSNNKIVVAHRRTYTGLGTAVQLVYRFNANGSPDNTFGGSGRVVVDSVPLNQVGDFSNVRVALLSSNKILLAGDTLLQTSPGNVLRLKLARLNTDGSFDNSFGPGGKRVFPSLDLLVNAVLADENQNIFVGGMVGGTNALVKVKSNGSLDTDFGNNGIATGGAFQFVMVDNCLTFSNGNLVLAGVTNNNDLLQTHEKSFDSQGDLNHSFGTNGISSIPLVGAENTLRAMAVQPDGKIVLALRRRLISGSTETDFDLVRVNAASSAVLDHERAISFPIYPNPSTGTLYFDPTIALAHVEVFSSLGEKMLRSEEISEAGLDVSGLPPGTYYLAAFGTEGQRIAIKPFIRM